MENKVNYVQPLTRSKENEIRKMKENPVKWSREFFGCILITEMLQ